jgi:hypothetical protein
MAALSSSMPSLSLKVLDVTVFIVGPLHPPWMITGLRLQLEELVYVLNDAPSFACLRVLLLYLVLIKFLNFEYAVAVLDSEPHFVHDASGVQSPLRARLVTVLLLSARLCARPE